MTPVKGNRIRALAVAGALTIAGAAGTVATRVQAQQPTPAVPGSLVTNDEAAVAPAASASEIPPAQLAVMQRVSGETGIPWQVFAAIATIESDLGRNMATSSAGAIGYGQFLPSTWAEYGQGGDPYDFRDVIPAMGRYLLTFGAPADLHLALYAYNHSWDYVNDVLGLATVYGAAAVAPPVAPSPSMASSGSQARAPVATTATTPPTTRRSWTRRSYAADRVAVPEAIEAGTVCCPGRAVAGLPGAATGWASAPGGCSAEA